MAIRIKARGGESTEQLLRRFKKLCEKEGLTKEVKKRAHFEKPSERARRDARKSLNRMRAITMGIPPKGPRGERDGPGGREGGPSSGGGARGGRGGPRGGARSGGGGGRSGGGPRY
jgi:small subunit ribosomal protein S21